MLDNNLQIMTIQDMLSNMSGNMSDEDIDSDIKLFRKISRALAHTNNYDNIVVVVGDSEIDYDPDSIDPYMDKESISPDAKIITDDAGVKFAKEMRNGTMFLYFKDEEDANDYIESVQEYWAAQDE